MSSSEANLGLDMRGRAYSGARGQRIREQIRKKREALRDNPEELQKFEGDLAQREQESVKVILVLSFILIAFVLLFLILSL